jgi:hypothetical protein
LLQAPFAGSKNCGECHRAQYAHHQKTGHARALARAPEGRGEWAFGAGDQAITYVSRLDDEHYIEHGLTWYAATKSLGITPGHRHAQGERYRTFDPNAAILRCFQCHSTGPLRLGEGVRIEPSEPGVQCEACHGAGADHAAVRNPRKLSAERINELCGACHRMPAAAGDDTDWNNPWNARHQPLYLNQSACFQKSKGALSCLTCHRAHEPVSRDAAGYDALCARCHAGVRHRQAAAGSCVGCHMPAVRPHAALRFANHWIGIYAAGKELRPVRRD